MFYRKLLSIIAIILASVVLFGCTPEQQAMWERLTPTEQQQVLDGLQANRPSRDCFEAVDRHFSGDKERMKRIVRRESGNDPSAKNKSSTASGCSQLLLSYHGHRFVKVGCAKGDWGNADCNIKAADHLYKEQGWRPWKLTDY